MAFRPDRIRVPFRMQPGLSRLDADAVHLTPLRPGSPLYREREALQRRGVTRHAVPGFDAAPALVALRAQARHAGVSAQAMEMLPLELQVEEDLVVLDTRTGRIPWMCVCVPSRWAPEDKLGCTLAEVHQPVADGDALVAALPAILRVLAQGGHWERHVWTLTPSARFDQHPARHPPADWLLDAGTDACADACWLRAERQTFFPVPDAQGQATELAVFTIRVMLEPLSSAIATADDAQRLHDALASMTDAVLQYKNLAPARTSLLAWLARRAGRDDVPPTPPPR